jgi:hypothetical protein
LFSIEVLLGKIGPQNVEKWATMTRIKTRPPRLSLAGRKVRVLSNNLAADSPEYETLAETLAYALDLADLGLSAESSMFDASEPPKAH